MPHYLRHDDIHLERGRKIGKLCRKKESDLKSFNNLKRAEEMGNPAEKKETHKMCGNSQKKYFKWDNIIQNNVEKDAK